MHRILLAATASVGLALPVVGHAASFVALTEDGTLHRFDNETRTVDYTVKPNGAGLRAIDQRPADGKLWGLGQDNALYTIDVAIGVATKGAMLALPVPPGAVAVDFNPLADRMRILAAGGMSLRVNVETGAAMADGSLKYAEASGIPKVEAAAYSFSAKGIKPTATRLYDLDLAMSSLMLQDPPNEGVLKPIGRVALPAGAGAAFDIESDGTTTNQGWLLSGGMLHRLDIATGAVTRVGVVRGLTGKVVDLAVLAD